MNSGSRLCRGAIGGVFTVVMILAMLPSLYAQGQWGLPVIPDRSDLLAIDLSSPGSGIAVGAQGVIRRFTDTGLVSAYPSSGTAATLRGVDLWGDMRALAVGDDGTILSSQDGGATWSRAISNTGVRLNAVRFRTSLAGITVGAGGTILRTMDGGSTWRHVAAPTTSDLYAVSFLGDLLGLAVGSAGVLLKTVDGGEQWQLLESGSTETLRSLSMVDAQQWRVAGDQGVFLETSDGGKTWDRQEHNLTGKFDCNGLYFFDEHIGCAVGVEQLTPLSKAPALMITTDGGDSWRSSPSAGFAEFAIGSSPEGIALVTGRDGLISRVQFIAGMTTLRVTPIIYNGSIRYASVSCADSMNCVAVANADSYEYRSGDGSRNYFSELWIERTTDGGRTWKRQYGDSLRWPGNGIDVYRVLCLDSLRAIAIGDSGMLLRTEDGGAQWRWQRVAPRANLRDIDFINADQGIVVSADGIVFRTSDGGTTWAQVTGIPSYTYTRSAARGGTYMLYGTGPAGHVLRSSDGGDSWSEYPVPTGKLNVGLELLSPANGWIASSRATGAGQIRSDVILRTTNGGQTWTVVLDKELGRKGGLEDIDFADDEHGIAVGLGTKILHTSNGGETWEERPIELIGEEPILGIAYPVKDRAVAVTGLGTILVYDGRASSVRLPAPLPDHAYCGAEDQPSTVVLHWSEIEGDALYRLQVGTDSTFLSSLILTEEALDHSEHAVSGLQPATRYYWRVQAHTATAQSDWSGICSFTTGQAGAVPAMGAASTGEIVLMEIHPNPASGRVTARLAPELRGECTLELYNSLGEQIHRSRISGSEYVRVPVESLPEGYYMVRVTSEKGSVANVAFIKSR